MKILHFADAHIDMANYGRHDPQTGLPLRVIDFLKSLDTIIDTAIAEQVDLVVFAGDAYRDRTPAPTFQREWGRRIMRLSRANIRTLLLVGNHDLSPALGRAHAIEEFSTLEVPRVRVIDKPDWLGPDELWDLPLQVIALPWVTRSGLMATLGLSAADPSKVYAEIEERLNELVQHWLGLADPGLPVILTAHASVQGAKFGGERAVMLGADLVLSAGMVKDPRLSYVALGHIHKPQDLNQGNQPPVIYPGSIERVDFGEAQEDRFFVIAHLECGQPTRVEWRKLEGVRPFIDRFVRLDSPEQVTDRLAATLPSTQQMKDAIVRLVVEYPREWETLIDESTLRQRAALAFEFHLVKRPHLESRVRLPADQSIGSLTPLELLEIYWETMHTDKKEAETLNQLAASIINEANRQEL